MSIDQSYVDGISITHGSPRTHIWTFASGQISGIAGADPSNPPESHCPCDPGNTLGTPPFVGNDYFCETVATVDNWNVDPHRLYSDNALWDGQDLLNPCYGLNNPPWFNKTLPAPTTDDIEFRLCTLNIISQSNFAIQLVEIFVN